MPAAPWKKIDQNLQSADLHALKQHLRCMEYEKRICDCLGGLPDPTSRNEVRYSCFVTNWILCSIFASGSYAFLAMLPACFLTASQGNVLLNRLGNATHPNTQIDEIVKTVWKLKAMILQIPHISSASGCLSYFCEDHACFLMPLDMLFLQLERFFIFSPLGPLLVILHSFPSYHSFQEVFLSTAALHPSPLAPSSWSHHRTPHCLLSVSSTGLETIRVWGCVHYSTQ